MARQQTKKGISSRAAKKQKNTPFTPGRGSRPGADAVSGGSKPVHARVWIEGKNDLWLNASRVKLLEGIGEYGSIAAAARDMKMSYAHAWKLVESMNASRPVLVEKVATGQRGGGARLTKAGEETVAFFHQTVKDLERFVEGVEKKLSRLF